GGYSASMALHRRRPARCKRRIMHFARDIRRLGARGDVVVYACFAAGLCNGARFNWNAVLHGSRAWTICRRPAFALFCEYYCLHLLLLGESANAAPISDACGVRRRMRVMDEKRRSLVCAGGICGDRGVGCMAA